MEIVLGRGVGEILFGMSGGDVIGKLGEPDKVDVDSDGSRNLIYFLERLILKIEPNSRLGWIEIHNKKATWLNINPWQLNKNALLELLSKALGKTYELDDYGTMESYFFNDAWVEVQFEFNELTSFNFGVRYAEDGNPVAFGEHLTSGAT